MREAESRHSVRYEASQPPSVDTPGTAWRDFGISIVVVYMVAAKATAELAAVPARETWELSEHLPSPVGSPAQHRQWSLREHRVQQLSHRHGSSGRLVAMAHCNVYSS